MSFWIKKDKNSDAVKITFETEIPLTELKKTSSPMTSTPDTALGQLLQAKRQPCNTELVELGIKVGKLYTDKGFPVDMALDRLEGYTKLQKLSILDGVCQWLIEHKRNSGATDKAIERQRQTNRKMVEDYLKTGETGVY